MAKITEYVNSLFDSANTVAGVINDYTTNEARRSTQNKQIQLKKDLQDKMMEIQRSSTSDEWQAKMDGYFQNVKSQMSDKNSPYYCKNNLQADMFDSILSEAQVTVSNEVGQLVFKADRDKAIVEYQNTLETLAQTETPENFLKLGNEAAKNLRVCGFIDEDQLQQQYNNNHDKAYINAANNYFNNTVEEAIRRGDSEQTVIDMVFQNMPQLTATDTTGLPKMRDTTQLKETLTKTMKQSYRAKQQDIWNEAEKNFVNLYDNMLDQRTAEGYNSIALQGRVYIDSIKNTGLASPEQVAKWTKVFQLVDDAKLSKMFGGGSGSGSNKPDEKYEDLFKYNGETAVDIWEKGLRGNMYDITGMMGEAFAREWWNPVYKENYDKSEQELQTTFELKYKGKTSQNSIVDAVYNKFIEKFPEIKELVGSNFKKLRDDMNKHPEQYGTQDVEKMGYFLLDAIYSANPNTKSEDILKQFEQYKNDCYLSRVKYIELDKNGNLTKTFNASNPKDIAKAARLAMDNDYVYTWQGKEYWADGKKEALEAKGGIVNVLESAVIGAAGIPQSDVDAGKVGFKYKQTNDDMTSQPIITYGDKEYEVIPEDNDKGFKVIEYHIDKNNKREKTRELEGKIGGKTKEERLQAKADAKQTVKDTHGNTFAIENKRADETNTKIAQATEMPKAMKAAGKVKDIEWNTSNGDTSKRQIYLQDTVSAMDADAQKVKNTLENPNTKKKKQMQPSEFEKEYGIDYYTWIRNSETTYRFNLILNSK